MYRKTGIISSKLIIYNRVEVLLNKSDLCRACVIISITIVIEMISVIIFLPILVVYYITGCKHDIKKILNRNKFLKMSLI